MACNSCQHDLYTTLTIFNKFETAHSFFISHQVLPDKVYCSSCAKQATFQVKRLRWRCQKTRMVDGVRSKCDFTQSIKKSTCLEDAHISIEDLGKLITYYLYLPPPHQKFLEAELHLASHTVVKWSQFVREAALEWCLSQTSQTLGGPNEIVEVDEAKFGRRKYNRGRVVEGQWVLGGVQRGSPNIFLEVVERRDQETLMEVLHRRVLPGTTIITDGWRAYNPLSQEGMYKFFFHQLFFSTLFHATHK